MAQTTILAPKLRALYKRYISFHGFDKPIKFTLDSFASLLAHTQRFSFPKKFNWEWKLEMLMKRYERETLDLFKKIIKPGMHVVDIGAHIGYFSRIFSRLVGTNGLVSCFEADPQNYSLLERNTRGRNNVRLFQIAVSDKNGSIDFFHIENSTGCHSVIRPDSKTRKITVQSVALDEMIVRGKLKPVDIIKIDIEGGEPLAFAGMKNLLRNSPNLQLITEFNQSSLKAGGVNPDDFLMQLESFGFTIFCIIQGSLIPIRSLKDNNINSYLLPTGYVNLYCKK